MSGSACLLRRGGRAAVSLQLKAVVHSVAGNAALKWDGPALPLAAVVEGFDLLRADLVGVPVELRAGMHFPWGHG